MKEGALIYLAVGAFVATGIRMPLFGRNWFAVTALWPWPVAAHVVHRITGKLPRWTPPL